MKPDKLQQRVFVEGHTDAAVINKLVLARLQVNLASPPNHQIVEPADGGFDGAVRRFEAALSARRPERLGFVEWFGWLIGP